MSSDSVEGLSAKIPKRSKESRRSYQERWGESYFVCLINNDIRCVICRTSLAYPKESNILRHYKTHTKQIEAWAFLDDAQRTVKYRQLQNNLVMGPHPIRRRQAQAITWMLVSR